MFGKVFYSYSSPSFPSSSYINLLIGPYFISAALSKKIHLSSPAGSVSYKTIWIRLVRLSAFKTSLETALVRVLASF